MPVKAALRILAVALVALPLLPLQIAAVRWGWRLRARLPVLFHRIVLGIIGVKVDTRGAPEPGRPLLIVANHVSWLDIPVIGSLMPLSFVAKSEVAGWPVIGLFARLQRSVFIERERRHKTGAATAAIGERLTAGDAMVLFGEGTTGDGVRVLPFRSALIGAAQTALRAAQAPVLVQPLAIRYARRDGLPISRAHMPALSWIGDMDLAPHLIGVLAGGPVDVVVSWGEAVPYGETTDRKALARRLEGEARRMMKA